MNKNLHPRKWRDGLCEHDRLAIAVFEDERYDLEIKAPILSREIPRSTSFSLWMSNEREAKEIGLMS